jgi:hypothetical protein
MDKEDLVPSATVIFLIHQSQQQKSKHLHPMHKEDPAPSATVIFLNDHH